MTTQHLAALTYSAAPTPRGVAYLAGTPIDTATAYIKPWTTAMIVFGAVILGGCLAYAAISMGARSAAAKKGDNTHMREGIGKIVGVCVAGFFLGISLLAIGLAVKLGQTAPAS